MTRQFFREKWEPYFSSFTDNELFALKFMVSEMHRKATWFTNVGRIIDAWVVVQRKDQVAEAEQLVEEAAAEQQEHAVH